jgi:hypothetical protein
LERDSFVSLAELKVLLVRQCGLRTIELGAFNGLSELTTLTLSGNEISEIIPGTFESLGKLERLDLSYNTLEHLDIDVFSGLVNLKYVSLEQNQLQYLLPDTFLGLPNIKHISLHNNPGLQIPTDSNFINSHSLSHLDIVKCKVSSLSVETIANVSALERLDMRGNNLKTVDINILRALPKLSELNLDDNPLQCDCQLQEVWRWFEDHEIVTGKWHSAPKCDTPSEVAGMWWGVLEKGECIQGNIQYCGDYKNTSYTYTDIKHEVTYKYDFYKLKVNEFPIYVVPFILGTTCNVILLIIIICNKDMQTVPNMYILNLAISDIINLTVVFTEACANTILGNWFYGDLLCTFLSFCRRLSVGLTAYSVAVLSIQRYRVTVNPLHAHVYSPPTWRVTVATICGVWIVAGLIAVPSALSKYLCFYSNSSTNIPYYKRVVIFELLVSCVLPLCVIGFSYITTARHLVISSRPISEETQNPQLNTRRITAKIVLALTVVFLISFVPYHVFWAYIFCTAEVPYRLEEYGSHYSYPINTFFNWKDELELIYIISTSLLLLNSCLNPVALFCISSQFRQHLKRYLTCFIKTNSPPTDLELASRN